MQTFKFQNILQLKNLLVSPKTPPIHDDQTYVLAIVNNITEEIILIKIKREDRITSFKLNLHRSTMKWSHSLKVT